MALFGIPFEKFETLQEARDRAVELQKAGKNVSLVF
jgi:hypothetical protein